MWLNLTGILFICLLTVLIPSGVWEKIYRFNQYLASLWKTFGSRRLSRGEVFRGRELQRVISSIICDVSIGRQVVSISVPNYKFYGSTTTLLLKLNRRYGVPLREPLGDLQKTLSVDLKFEKKISAIYLGAFAQLLVISAIVWSFSVVTHSVTGLARSFVADLTVLIVQLSGGLALWAISNWLRSIMLGWLSLTLGPMTAFHSLLSVGLSCAEVSSLSNIDGAALVLKSRFTGEHDRLVHLLREWRERGISIGGEWKTLMDDVWNLGEEYLARYTARLETVKFVVLAVFFLGSYFVYIGHLFDRFLIE